MIQDIKTAAESVGITAVITNSKERIESQLNRITGVEDLPLMLVSWDLETTITFNEHGDLNNPITRVVVLLMDKASDTTKEEAESTAEGMATLFQQFVKALYSQLIPYQKQIGTEILSDIGFTLAPQHGMGKHSGILGRFSMQTAIANC
mgnify:FL=1|jgi:hypothetical protein|tara:strand:- start:1244 stop:1690 length:447 start_codon:yes stop_codon:yes gene_type:complete